MTPIQLHILQHSLGCDQYGKTTYRGRGGEGAFGHYRNRYVSDPTPDLVTLVETGYLKDHGPYEIAGNMHYYRVTELGLAKMRELSPAPPKVSRAKQRYIDFLDMDLGCSFGEWLKNGWYRRETT